MKKRLLASLMAALLIFSSVGVGVFAEETEVKNNEETQQSAEVKKFENIEQYLEYSARYRSDKGNLYQGALEKILQENPDLYTTAMKGMLSSIDSHSAFYTTDEADSLYNSLNDKIVGIGVNVLLRDDYLIVSQPIPNSPADRVGIKTGDIIVSANGESLKGLTLDEAVDHIRGEKGTTVTVEVERSGINGTLKFDIVRDEIVSNPIYYEAKEKDDGTKIAYIKIYSFTENCSDYFRTALAKADEEKIKNIIIDVRDNGGGYLEQAINIADLFLPKNAVITTEDHNLAAMNSEYRATGKGKTYEVVMLVNGLSASASEVLTSALKENGVAKIIGTKTFGKGTVQSVVPLADGSVIKYTAAFYLTPKGNNINEIGITPDAVVENSQIDIDMSKFGEFSYSNVYAEGDKAEEIKTAKEMLQYLGIYNGVINDVYDTNMRLAVYTYQTLKQELFAYGELDKTTQFTLYDDMSKCKEETDDQLDAAIDAF